MIKYDKMFTLLKEKGWNSNINRTNRLISESTLQSIREGTGGLSHKTIDKLCEYLECQPGDLMEWVKEENHK